MFIIIDKVSRTEEQGKNLLNIKGELMKTILSKVLIFLCKLQAMLKG